MMERRPASIAQPRMTALACAAERELESYGQRTALASPVDFVDRVMAAIEAGLPAPRYRWIPLAALDVGRVRMAGGMVAVLIAMLGGAALVAGASAIFVGDLGAQTDQAPDNRPIFVVEPTATAADGLDDPSIEALESAAPPEPDQRDAVRAIAAPGDAPADEPKASGDVDEPGETDEPEATDAGRDGDDGADESEETDEPEDGGPGDSGEDEGGQAQEPDGS